MRFNFYAKSLYLNVVVFSKIVVIKYHNLVSFYREIRSGGFSPFWGLSVESRNLRKIWVFGTALAI